MLIPSIPMLISVSTEKESVGCIVSLTVAGSGLIPGANGTTLAVGSKKTPDAPSMVRAVLGQSRDAQLQRPRSPREHKRGPFRSSSASFILRFQADAGVSVYLPVDGYLRRMWPPNAAPVSVQCPASSGQSLSLPLDSLTAEQSRHRKSD